MKINKWIILLVAFLAIIIALSAVKDNIIKFVVEKAVEGTTGLHLSIGDMEVGILETRVDIKDLRLYNPRGYRDRIMLDMPEIYVDYDLPAIFKGIVHFKKMKVNMKEFIVEKNAKGDLNLNSLNVMSDGGEQPSAPAKKGPGMQLQIDTLELKVGKVLYKDYSQGGDPEIQDFDVDIDQTYQNITDLKSLVSLILVQSLAKTTISKLANFEINKLQQSISDKLISSIIPGGKIFGSAEAGKALGGVVQNLEKEFTQGTGGGE